MQQTSGLHFSLPTLGYLDTLFRCQPDALWPSALKMADSDTNDEDA